MGSKHCHILLVEDEEAHAELIRRAFARRGGTDGLTVAYTLGEARRCLAKAPPADLVIADLLLPDGKGTDLLPGNGAEATYPLVLITGHGDEEAAVAAMKAGALDYVVKSDVTLADMPHIAERALRHWEHIVERRQAEEALRKSEARFRELADLLPETVFQADPLGRLTFLNRKGLAAFQITHEDLNRGIDTLKTVAPQDRDRAARNMQRMLMAEDVPGVEYTALRKDGATFPVVAYSTCVTHDAQPVALIGIIIDITERKRQEETLRVYHDRLRALAFELSQAEERERRRVATFLHDNIAQALTMVRIKLDATRASVSSPDLARSLAEVRDLLLQPVSDIRSLTFDLSPPVLYELGFEAALEWLAETTQQRHGLPCVLEDDGKPGLLGDAVEVIVFRAVQELLANAVKHARAKTVKVSVCHTEDGNICVQVRDDGVGFDADAAGGSAARGFGLFNMRERLKDVGGCLQLESAPRRGTLAVLTVPAIHEPKRALRGKRT
jgi:PAS domain S-box-containing protein